MPTFVEPDKIKSATSVGTNTSSIITLGNTSVDTNIVCRKLGINDAAPGTTVQVTHTAPYMTLKNSTAENTNGGCESKIIFEDHGDNALGQIECHHNGGSDDEKGKMIISTNNDSGIQAAITIDDSQDVTFARDITVSGDDISFGSGATIVNTSSALLTITEATTHFSAAVTAGGDITAFSSSDKRLKTNILPIQNPLTKLQKVGGYTFDWIPKEGVHSHEGTDIGVIAQEIEEVLPEITTTRDNGYKAVKYEKLTAFLLECIKEQQQQINTLQERVELLEKK